MPIPLLSVCVITYNHEKYIRQCLEGVMMQRTNFNFEVVVGEDCSSDHTRDIVDEFAARYPGLIRPVYQPFNIGGARNAYDSCYPMLKGKYIAVCEGDDYWTDPLKLQKQVDFLEQNPGYVMCFHRVKGIDENNALSGEQQEAGAPAHYSRQEILHISIPTLSVVFRKCFEAIPPEMFKVKSGDVFLFALLSKYGKAADLGFAGGVYRKHSGGVFSPRTRLEQWRQSIKTRKSMLQCSAFPALQHLELRKEIRKRKLRYVKFFLKKKELTNCFRIILA